MRPGEKSQEAFSHCVGSGQGLPGSTDYARCPHPGHATRHQCRVVDFAHKATLDNVSNTISLSHEAPIVGTHRGFRCAHAADHPEHGQPWYVHTLNTPQHHIRVQQSCDINRNGASGEKKHKQWSHRNTHPSWTTTSQWAWTGTSQTQRPSEREWRTSFLDREFAECSHYSLNHDIFYGFDNCTMSVIV